MWAERQAPSDTLIACLWHFNIQMKQNHMKTTGKRSVASAGAPYETPAFFALKIVIAHYSLRIKCPEKKEP
jgi:hypothetical protein